MGGGFVVIELAVGLAAVAALAGLLWWYDSQREAELEILLSAESDVLDFLERQFAAEERALDGTCNRAADAMDRGDAVRLLAAGTSFLGDLVPHRLMLLQRLDFYSKIARAFGPAPSQRIVALRRGYVGLMRNRPDAEWLAASRRDFRALNQELLTSWRRLFAASRKEL